MNQKTTYELTITDKLQLLSLPGMEDAIWARVKQQLDLDLPTDDVGGPSPDAPAGGGWVWGTGLFVFIASLATIFLLTKKEPEQSPVFSPAATPANTITTSPNTTPPQPGNSVRGPSLNAANSPPAQQPGLTPNAPPLLTAADSALAAPFSNLQRPDSLQGTMALLPPLTAQDTTARTKAKTRGVKGLTDDDYRIVPAKKDSL